MDFRDLLLALRRYWVAAAGVALLVCGIGGAAAFLPQKTYRSAATIVLDFSDESTATIQEVNFLLPALEQRAQSQRLADAAQGRVPEELRTPRPAIDAVIDASVLRIGATATRPVAAQAWADAAAEQLIEEREGEPPLELELLEPAPFRAEPVSPKVLPILMATLVVALVAAVFAGLAADRVVTVYRQSFGRTGAEPDEPVKVDRDRVDVGAVGRNEVELVPEHDEPRVTRHRRHRSVGSARGVAEQSEPPLSEHSSREFAAQAGTTARSAVESASAGQDVRGAGEESLYELSPIPLMFASSPPSASIGEPMVDLGRLAPETASNPALDAATTTLAAPDQAGVEQPRREQEHGNSPPTGATESPVGDDQPNERRRVPGTHLDRRIDEPPRPAARSSVFEVRQVDRYDPSVRGRGIVGSPSLPGEPTRVPTLPVSSPAVPPPVVEPVSNSTTMSHMTGLRSAQLRARHQQRQGKLIGRSLIAFVLVGGLVAGALVFGRSLLFTVEWDARLTPIVSAIEAERGAPFDHPVALASLDPIAFGDRVRAATIGDAWVDEVPAWRALNLTTGIVTAESVAAEMAQDTLALYDADGDVILVVADADPVGARADLRLALEMAYVAQNDSTAPGEDVDPSGETAAPEVATGFVGVSPTKTIARRAVDNFLASTATAAERRAASERLPIPIAYQLAAVKTLGEPILAAADLDPASLSIGGPYPEMIGDVLDDDPVTTASALLQPGERSLADPVALGNDDWSLVWSTLLPADTVDRLVDEVVADAYRPIDRGGRTCVVGVFQTVDEPAGGSVFAAMSSWAAAAPAASNAVASQLGPSRVQLEVCDPGAENGVAAPVGVADGLIDRQRLRLTN